MEFIGLGELAEEKQADEGDKEEEEEDPNVVFLNRQPPGDMNFRKNWADYKAGFGDEQGEFWLGLDQLHEITNSKQYGLQVDMEDFEGNNYQSRYSSFSVGPESDRYRLSISGYDESSTGGDSLTPSNNKFDLDKIKFSTQDKDSDKKKNNNCAKEDGGGGGWWYNQCSLANPTGRFLSGGKINKKGMIWYKAKNNQYSFKTMKLTLVPN